MVEYLKDLNATQAAIRAGYSRRSARKQGSRLWTNADIQAAVQEKAAKRLTDTNLTVERILEEMRRLAFVDARGFWDKQGNLKEMGDLTAEQGSALAGFEAIIKNAKAGDHHTDTIHKIKLWDKTKALDMLGRHFNLLTDQVRHTGEFTFSWQPPPTSEAPAEGANPKRRQ